MACFCAYLQSRRGLQHFTLLRQAELRILEIGRIVLLVVFCLHTGYILLQIYHFYHDRLWLNYYLHL